MLKWTVKKRPADDDALSVYGEENSQIRKLHSRRSMGDALTENHRNSRNIRRRSLGNFHSNNRISSNKENQTELTPVRTIVGRESSTPLNDSSNFHKACKRKHHVIAQSEKVRIASPTMSPISLATAKDIFFKEPPTVIFQSNYAPTLPSFDIEYSPSSLIMKAATTQHNPIIKRQAMMSSSICSYDHHDDVIPPKRLKFDALDMSYEFKPEMATTSSPLSTPLTVRKFSDENNRNKIQLTSISSLSGSELSLNSSEVGDMTLQKMIDDILASARHGKKFKKCFPAKQQPQQNRRDRNSNFVKPLSVLCENMEQKSIENLLSASKIAQAAERTLIIADDIVKNEREVREKSPPKTDIEIVDLKTDDTCHLKRQNAVRRKNTSNENKNRKKLSDSEKADKENIHQDSTIQKCLSFSSANYDDISEKLKRSSVASNSSTSSASYVSQSKFTKNLLMKGSLELATTCDENKRKISIHVKRCKNLMKPSDNCHINAYVKCALTVLKSSSSQNIYQRTAVHKNSTCPIFDHNFVFDIDEAEDITKYLQIAVWHRNKNLKKSELLGCLTISVQDVLNHNIEGSFLLQSQSSLSKPMKLIREVEEKSMESTTDTSSTLLKYLELNTDINDEKSVGRTPLTLTKVIQKQPNGSFGFEISWSKPPKINSICNEQIKTGIKQGDYLIFIDQVNVVTLPKEEVIELIRKQIDCLRLEVFRPLEKLSSNEMIEKLAAQSTPVAACKNVSSLSYEAKCTPIGDLSETPKSHRSSCHFKQPKVHFQPSIGNGIFV